MKVLWSPLALQKLGEIADFIALDNPAVAAQWVNLVFDKVAMLATQPFMGRMVPELSDPNYREIIFGNYRLIYRLNDSISILTVRNCRQLLTATDL